jgi:hypothetical protein
MSRDYRAVVQVYGVRKDEICFTKHFLTAVDFAEVSHLYGGPKKLYTVHGSSWVLLTAGRSPANYADSLVSNIHDGLSRKPRVRIEMRLVQFADPEVFDTEDPYECSGHRDDCPCSVCRAYRIAVSAQM